MAYGKPPVVQALPSRSQWVPDRLVQAGCQSLRQPLCSDVIKIVAPDGSVWTADCRMSSGESSIGSGGATTGHAELPHEAAEPEQKYQPAQKNWPKVPLPIADPVPLPKPKW